MVDWEKVSSVMGSGHRQRALQILSEDSPRRGKELSDRMEISMSHSSEVISSLRELNLVKCLTPEKARDRLFSITEEGENLLKYLRKEGLIEDE